MFHHVSRALACESAIWHHADGGEQAAKPLSVFNLVDSAYGL